MKDIVKYSERNGKNSGVMALKAIKQGTLILTEKAQFKPKFEHKIRCIKQSPCKPCYDKVMAAYNNMNSVDQDEYLKLSNVYDSENHQSNRLILKRAISTMFPSSEVESFILYIIFIVTSDVRQLTPPKLLDLSQPNLV